MVYGNPSKAAVAIGYPTCPSRSSGTQSDCAKDRYRGPVGQGVSGVSAGCVGARCECEGLARRGIRVFVDPLGDSGDCIAARDQEAKVEQHETSSGDSA